LQAQVTSAREAYNRGDNKCNRACVDHMHRRGENQPELPFFAPGSTPRNWHVGLLARRFFGKSTTREWQINHDLGPSARAVRSPYLPAMGAHHRLHERQPKAASG
jgi:hypothetical protein